MVLVNPLGSASIHIRKPEDNEPEKWINELKKLKESIEGLGLNDLERREYLYHLFYAFLEPIYYECYPGHVGPADTSAPTILI